MEKILKKISIVSVLMLSMFMFSGINALAYHNEDEEQLQMDSEVEKLEKEIRSKQTVRSLKSQKEFTVVIDAGHGGKDSGAANTTLKFYEKNLNLDIAKAIEKRLTGHGINVVMTRNTDVFLELAQRSARANAIGADLFVSVHNDTQSGNGDGAHIIHSVNDNNGGMSKTLATNIGNSIKNNTSQNLKKYNPIWSRYSSDNKSDYYAVIRQTKMPAVIVEHAFMNANDIKAVDTLEKRNIMGNAVADGIYKTIKGNFSGWVKYKDAWKYYNPTQNVKSVSWEKINGTWYYFDDSGVMQTGWEKVDNIWYYLDGSGAMQTGWEKINNTWYYLDGSGAMQTGWRKIDNVWYNLESNGAMTIGWLEKNGNKYYLEKNGAMVTGETIIDNITYLFKETGELINN